MTSCGAVLCFLHLLTAPLTTYLLEGSKRSGRSMISYDTIFLFFPLLTASLATHPPFSKRKEEEEEHDVVRRHTPLPPPLLPYTLPPFPKGSKRRERNMMSCSPSSPSSLPLSVHLSSCRGRRRRSMMLCGAMLLLLPLLTASLTTQPTSMEEKEEEQNILLRIQPLLTASLAINPPPLSQRKEK